MVKYHVATGDGKGYYGVNYASLERRLTTTKEYIERGALYRKVAELEMLARDRYLDTPTNSPVYPRYMAQLGERTQLKFLIADFPAADVVEVKHGEWLDPIWDSDWHSMTATCSHCRERGEVRVKRNLQNILVIDSPRCPVCGAFMRGHGGADNG